MPFLRLLMCWWILSTAQVAPAAAPSQADLSYTVLSDITDTLPIREVLREFRVSVPRWLEVGEIRDLVCRITREHEIERSRRVRISIYHDLEEWVPEPDYYDPVPSVNLSKHMAVYEYSPALPADYPTLHVYKDRKGRQLSKSISKRFNHWTDCATRN